MSFGTLLDPLRHLHVCVFSLWFAQSWMTWNNTLNLRWGYACIDKSHRIHQLKLISYLSFLCVVCSGEKPYSCPECHKAFSQKNSLQIHMNVHTRERPHKCPYCDQSFAQKGRYPQQSIQPSSRSCVYLVLPPFPLPLPLLYSDFVNVASIRALKILFLRLLG